MGCGYDSAYNNQLYKQYMIYHLSIYFTFFLLFKIGYIILENKEQKMLSLRILSFYSRI